MTLNLPQKRKAVTDSERLAIRKRQKEHPSIHKELIEWFEQQHGHRLVPSQITRILSSKYAHLDELNPKSKQDKKKLEAQRAGKADWPDLEGALFEWQQRLQTKNAIITGEILKQQAMKLWKALPQYRDLEQTPKFSNGWLVGFKARYNIREYIQHGEAGSADIYKPDAITQMAIVRALAEEYGPDNTLNMDETGLFWKMTPDRTLATKAKSGGKKAKDRVTLAFTCSASGKKEQTWVIGKSKNPRCFKGLNRDLLRIKYRYNKSK